MADVMTDPVEVEAGAPPAADDTPRWRRTLSLVTSNRLALFGMVTLVVLVLVALLDETLAPYGYNAVDVPSQLQAPTLDHPFGTDNLGRDVLSRVLLGAKVSLQVGVVAVGLSLTAGTTIGLVAGYVGGKLDDLLMRAMDVLFAFPAILMAIAVLAILGPGTTNAMVAIGIVYTPIFARVARASTLSVREEVYVRAARSAGASDLRIMRLHILPNIAAPVIVQASISLAFAILAEAALSFLGLGTQAPNPSWGRMLSEGREFLQQAWWMALFPGLAIFVTVLSFNVLGDALRDALDPRQASAMESRGFGS
ncbi:Dipeptide transport system permease protein DppC [Euzebya pacifica]|uniref:Dipeptide transport system permease protein DppC n=2 Tax=Euzebya pacifica TaxID=1608957 RepID=A0A346XWK0_9ACTN|nr:ABC transporter permease [Euzebya pacifica]AXV06597.1 Dipeptide transport system permease protein DppC [Euzebya pacifica]